MGKTLRNTVVNLPGRADAALLKAAQDNRGNAGLLLAVKQGGNWALASDAQGRAVAGAKVDALAAKDGRKVGERALNTPEYLARLQADNMELVIVDDAGAVSGLRYVEEDA